MCNLIVLSGIDGVVTIINNVSTYGTIEGHVIQGGMRWNDNYTVQHDGDVRDFKDYWVQDITVINATEYCAGVTAIPIFISDTCTNIRFST